MKSKEWCSRSNLLIRRFFFQAEDGIRDGTVTGFRRVLFRSVSYSPRKNQAARKKPADSLARSSRSPNGFLHTNTRSRMGVASSITSKEVVVSKFLVLYRSQIGRASCRERV